MTKYTNPFTMNDYEIVKREVLYEGASRLVRYHFRAKQYNGGVSSVFIREVLERNPAVAVLPYDPKLDQVILIEQFRAGTLSNPKSPWVLEIIAGLFDEKEETAEEAIKRESEEEAGCKLLDLIPISEYFTSPGILNERDFVFCGRADTSHAGGIHGLEEENEDIRTFVFSTEEAFQLLREGIIRTGPAIIALQWLQINHEWLKQIWQTK